MPKPPRETKPKYRIRKEFAAIHRDHTPKEEEELIRSLLQDGCMSPLVLWGDVIVEGMRRYPILLKYKIPFKVRRKEFANDAECAVWIRRFGRARRNLSKEELDKDIALEHKTCVENGIAAGKSIEELATKHKMSKRSVWRTVAAQEAKAKISDWLRKKIESKAITAKDTDLVKFVNLPDDVKSEVSRALRVMQSVDMGHAIKQANKSRASNGKAKVQQIVTPKNFNDATVDEALAKLVRMFDERGALRNELNKSGHRECVSILNSLLGAWSRWRDKK